MGEYFEQFFQQCNSVRTCIPKSFRADSAENEEKEDVGDNGSGSGTVCDQIRGSLKTSQICGASPIDYNRRGKPVETPGRKKGGKSNASLEKVLMFKLPNLYDLYKIVEGKRLGAFKLATHKESKHKRAVLAIPKKSIPQAASGSSDDTVKEVLERLKLLLKIDHVNVLALYEACEDTRCLYLIYAWPEGGLMLDFLTSYHEEVTEAHLSSITREVLAATAAANVFNVHHLDWSLLVIFLGYQNRFSPVKVFGFGLAGSIVPLVTVRIQQKKGSRANKHFYASPELLTENYRSMPHQKLHICDVWSIGTLVYMLFSGRPPFYGSNEEVGERIRRGVFHFGYEFDTISREAKDGVEKMLTKKWENRPPASDLLRHPFMSLQVTGRRKEGVICQDALSKLDQFAKETHCKQTLARLLADLGLQDSQYDELEKKFKQLDLDGNGVIEVGELCEIAARLPDSDDAEAVKKVADIIKHCDRNENQTVDISEFVAAVVLELENKDERLLVRAFDKMDVNGDARITKGELFVVLRQYSDTLEPEDVTSFVKDMDKDLDQKIDYNEFKFLFPHMKDRDNEVKGKIRQLALDIEDHKKDFERLQTATEKFQKDLRTAAGLMAIEYIKMHKSGGNEMHIAQKLKALIKVVEEFAGRTTDADMKKMKEDAEKRERSTLTGLTMMHKYNTTDTLVADADKKQASERSGDRSGSDTETKAAIARRSAFNTNMTDSSLAADKTVAEEYLIRDGCMRGRSYKEIKKEAKRRRRYLWLGGGDGIKNLRSAIMRHEISGGFGQLVANRNRNLRAGYKRVSEMEREEEVEKVVAGGKKGKEAEGQEVSESSEGESSISSDMSFMGMASEAKKAGRREGQDDDDEEDDMAKGLIPWSTSKKWKYAKEAMSLASGPALKELGFLHGDALQDELSRVGRKYLDEYALHHEVGKELTDLTKLIRYKCARTWLPRLHLWVAELKASLDEQRVHVFDRRKIHLDCIKHAMQTVERIMFAMADFLLWQEEAYQATWAAEEICTMPPASKRFLPYRGDIDDDARTPRDEDDALQLAPAPPEEEDEWGKEGGDKRQSVSFAEGEMPADNVGLTHASQSAANLNDNAESRATGMNASIFGASHFEKLDRTVVRKHKSKDPKKEASVVQMAKQEYKQAQAMSQSFYAA